MTGGRENMVDKNQFVKDLRMGDNVDSLFAVKYKKPPREYASGFWFDSRPHFVHITIARLDDYEYEIEEYA